MYHGTHTVIGKQAALKVLNAEFSSDPRIASRFIDEARAVNRIAHPNIVDIFGFGELQDGRKYCVMELLHGETLAGYLETQGLCEWPAAARILTQIAAALDAAHEQQIVHRDLKPDNIFMSRKPGVPGAQEEPSIKLLDFGIARVAAGAQSGHATASGVVLGTPAYMSPEQCRGAHVDRRTDVYALGVVAFEMLTGKLPFTGSNALQLIWAHLNQPPPIPTELNPALPVAVNAALARLLAKAPEERPERASDGVRELLLALGQPASSALSAAPPAAAAPSKSRLGWLFAGAALLALVAAWLVLHPAAPPAEPEPAPIAKAGARAVAPLPAPPAPLANSAVPGSTSAAASTLAPTVTPSSAPTKKAKPKATRDLEY